MKKILLTACSAVLFTAMSSMSAGYVEVLDWGVINTGGTSANNFGHVIDGTTAYFQLTGGSPANPRITKVTDIGGTPSTVDLITTADWTAASGGTGMVTFYGLGLSGDYLQFAETTTDAIWRVNKNTGLITEYVSKAQLNAHDGSTDLYFSNTVNPFNGEHVFYAQSRNILSTDGSGNLVTLVTSAELTAAFGNNTVRGGLTFDASGNLYWGNHTDGGLARRTSGGSLETVLTQAQIQAVTGNALVPDYRDIFYAPNGNIYFFELRSENILYFDPLNAASTLAILHSNQELVDGPGDANVGSMGWYNNNLTWNQFTGGGGLYNTIPEPSTLILVGLSMATLFFGRRKMKK